MLSELSWEDFLRWQAYDMISPIGDRRGDWQTAKVCATLVNVFKYKKPDGSLFTTADFLLPFAGDEEEAPQPVAAKEQAAAPSWQRMKFIARQQTALANADQRRASRRATKPAERKINHGRRR